MNAKSRKIHGRKAMKRKSGTLKMRANRSKTGRATRKKRKRVRRENI
jgi:hypothetical protein